MQFAFQKDLRLVSMRTIKTPRIHYKSIKNNSICYALLKAFQDKFHWARKFWMNLKIFHFILPYYWFGFVLLYPSAIENAQKRVY